MYLKAGQNFLKGLKFMVFFKLFITLFIILDEALALLSSEEASEEYFETLLSSLQTRDASHKIFTLVFAFWLYTTSIETMPSHIVYKYFKLLDTALILYGPDPDIVELIDASCILRTIPFDLTSLPDSFEAFSPENKLSLAFSELVILKDPSISIFQKNMMSPVIIEGLTANWPALKKWDKPSFWVNTAGHRFFPVEIGRHYLDDDWVQDIIQLNDFFRKYVFNSNNENVAYIAQHNWIHQIPLLARDFEVPDICDIFLNPKMDRVMTHMWFGVKGTLTPLHYDKYSNVFTQIVGRKYILLVDPKFSQILSNGSDNNSRIIDENVSNFLRKHNILFNEVILQPGESLLIPPKWWHQVKSLSFSISISFWF